MKYLVLKIIGVLGLIVTPIIMNSTYSYVEGFGSLFARKTWFEACELLLIIFLVITMAGFARLIAKMKAVFDFHTDFDDDQHLDFYPKIKWYSFIKKIITIIVVVAIIVISVLKEDVIAIYNNYSYIMLFIAVFVFVLYLANIIICLVAKVAPLYYDRGVILIIIGFAIEEVMMYFGCKWIIAMMVPAPLYALAVLYIASALEDFISIDEIFDWLCYEEYEKYYKMLCEKEKSQESEARIEKKISVRNTRKNNRKSKIQAVKDKKLNR